MYSKQWIDNHLPKISAVSVAGSFYIVDYFNFANECDNNEACLIVVCHDEKYLVDNENEYKRIYISELADREDVVIYGYKQMTEGNE